MDSDSAFRAKGASLAGSAKKSNPEDQRELDLVQQLSSELGSVTDGALSEAAEAEAYADNEPLTIYLKEIRSVQLLTCQQEFDVAKSREAGQSKIVESILSTPVALQDVLGLAGKIHDDEVRLFDLIEGLTTASAAAEFRFDRRDVFLRCGSSIQRRSRQTLNS